MTSKFLGEILLKKMPRENFRRKLARKIFSPWGCVHPLAPFVGANGIRGNFYNLPAPPPQLLTPFCCQPQVLIVRKKESLGFKCGFPFKDVSKQKRHSPQMKEARTPPPGTRVEYLHSGHYSPARQGG